MRIEGWDSPRTKLSACTDVLLKATRNEPATAMGTLLSGLFALCWIRSPRRSVCRVVSRRRTLLFLLNVGAFGTILDLPCRKIL
eukprot:XP_001706543.1 Hypothetical protein GL50803_94128 [Giardia lamblia ATCC 50803]